MKKIFLIEKAWIDPMENRNAIGYDPLGFYESDEEDVKAFCEKGGVFLSEDCWEIHYAYPNGMPKLRYTELSRLNDIGIPCEDDRFLCCEYRGKQPSGCFKCTKQYKEVNTL